MDTEILVIGGGATGLGVAHEAVLRGFKTVLVEQGGLAHGTSGRHHGLLHSGGRYVVRDPVSAAECWHENQILKRIVPAAIELTGGFFVALPEDPPDYVPLFLGGCRNIDLPAEEIPLARALAEEPLLNPKAVRVVQVPDASCDAFDLVRALAESIRAGGGMVLTHHRVTRVLKAEARVVGVEVEQAGREARFAIHAALVVNCAGPWAGEVAKRAGGRLAILPSKGTLVAMNYRMVNTVLNRLKPPGDGDILVPVGTVAVMGTTDIPVASPDRYVIEGWEVERLLTEGAKLVPRLREFRALRAWAGVRPLLQPEGQARENVKEAARTVSRAHGLLDHAERDGVENFVSVVGGKFTTFRLMAEQALDLVCRKLNTVRPSVSAATPLEPAHPTKFYTLGQRLAAAEAGGRQEIICECELVTRAQVEETLRASGSLDLNDLRRALRLGMGPCQAGFCAYRAAGLLRGADDRDPASGLAGLHLNSAWLEFLQERWKGVRPVAWGANLRQVELDLNIYRNILGVDRLPLQQAPEEFPAEKTA